MKINEILDSTKMWAITGGVNIDQINDLIVVYRQHIATINSLPKFKAICDENQFLSVRNQTIQQIELFNQALSEYVDSVNRLKISDDSDLRRKCQKARNMKRQLERIIGRM